MSKRIVRFCYRKIIEAASSKQWDKYVFESSYKEYLMQSQFYDKEKKFSKFSELFNNIPSSEKLHFLVSTSVIGYLKQLNGSVPDITNNLGKQFLKFSNFQFEIIESDVKNKQDHRVAISFYSDPMLWHDTIDNFLLVSEANGKKTEDGTLTHLLQVESFLSIYSLKEEL